MFFVLPTIKKTDGRIIISQYVYHCPDQLYLHLWFCILCILYKLSSFSEFLKLHIHAYAIYRDIFSALKIENFIRKVLIFFLIFVQNIDYGYTVLTSTHNPCFGAKIRKIGIPLHTIVLLYKSGV